MIEKKYFQNIDGLRAYAALAVVIFHLNIGILGYGWLGVQIFFVISGFLITNILIGSKNKESYFGHFYFRRSVRILPLYIICFTIISLYGLLNNDKFNDILWYVFFMQNWILGYTEGHSGFPAMFGHSWTLAIEQQFYLLWPFFVRYCTINRLLLICISGILISASSRIISGEYLSGYMISYSTFSHLDTLLGGALLAIIYNKRSELRSTFKYSILITILSFLVYYILIRTLEVDTFWNKYIRSNDQEWPITMLVFTPIIILAVHYLLISKNKIINFIFGNRLIVYLGKISYGIYLYHLIILHLFDNTTLIKVISLYINIGLVYILNPFIEDFEKILIYSVEYTYNILNFLKILFIIAISHLSYKYIESRFLQIKYKEK